jgi:SAM-dependent methyltransferase
MDPKRIIEEGYDRIEDRYATWVAANPPGVRGWFQGEVLRRLPAGADVLELGCGPGTAAVALASGRSYTGVDISRGQLAIARERLPVGAFVQGRLHDDPAPRGGVRRRRLVLRFQPCPAR